MGDDQRREAERDVQQLDEKDEQAHAHEDFWHDHRDEDQGPMARWKGNLYR